MNKFIKCWLFILCLLFIFLIILTDRVNAQTTTFTLSSATYQDTWTSSNTPGWVWSGTNAPLRNISAEGQILFNMSIEGKFKIYNISIKTNNINYACNYNSLVIYNDNTKQVQSLSVVCPTGWTGSSGVTEIRLEGESWQNNNVFRLGRYITFTDFGNDSDYGSVLGNIQTNSQDIITAIGYLRGDTQAVSQSITTQSTLIIQALNSQNTSLITQIQNQSTQQHQDAQTINNSITSNDVTGNNSSSSISSIGNTFSSQEDFLLNLLTIPYTLWTSILNVFSNSCSPLDVGTIFNYHLVFPCIELNQFLGGIYATIIDVIFTAIIYSAFIRRVMKYFRELLTLDDHALVTGGVKLW